MGKVHVRTKSTFDRGRVWYILTGIGVSTSLIGALACVIYRIWKSTTSIYIVRRRSCRPDSVSFADKDFSLNPESVGYFPLLPFVSAKVVQRGSAGVLRSTSFGAGRNLASV